jgi:hypothetical protein
MGKSHLTQTVLLTTTPYKNMLPVMPQGEAFDHLKRRTLDTAVCGIPEENLELGPTRFLGLGFICGEPAKSRQPEHGPFGIRRLMVENRSTGSGESRAF